METSRPRGLRSGELLAVRWRAIDLEVGTLAVRESVFEGEFELLKTQKVMRTISLDPRAITTLKTHQERAGRG